MPDPHRIGRRQFVESVAWGSSVAGTLLGPTLATAATETPPVEQKGEEKKEPPAPAVAPPSEEVLLLTVLTQRYPSEHFDEAALQGIYRDIRGDLARGRILSEFALKNSDEPAFVFRAHRGPR